MFGTITVPPELPDGVTLDGFAFDVDIAGQMMQVAADNRRSARLASKLGHTTLAIYHELLADGWVRRASDKMRAFRSAIAARTVGERCVARHLVVNGMARFSGVACAGETCTDCERPLWHHIVVNGSRQLCPFGREYWALARALVTEREYDANEVHQSFLSEIARG